MSACRRNVTLQVLPSKGEIYVSTPLNLGWRWACLDPWTGEEAASSRFSARLQGALQHLLTEQASGTLGQRWDQQGTEGAGRLGPGLEAESAYSPTPTLKALTPFSELLVWLLPLTSFHSLNIIISFIVVRTIII